MQKLTKDIIWNNPNAAALEQAVFDAPKIIKQNLEAICEVTGIKYAKKERDINFYLLLENLINYGLRGADFICQKIAVYYDLVKASEDLQTNIVELGNIVSKVNTRCKTKRDAVNLVKLYW